MTLPPDIPATQLEYSSLPGGSRVVIESTELGVLVRIPPAPFGYVVAGCIFALLMLLALTFCVVDLILNAGIYGKLVIAKVGFLAVVVLAFWPAAIVILVQAYRRRGVPTVLTVSGDKLILVTPQLPTLHHEFSIAEVRIKVRPGGFELPSFQRVGHLDIIGNKTTMQLLRGRRLREIAFVSHTLNGAIEKNRPGTPAQDLLEPASSGN
jgi:hypothetical protein